MRFNFPKPFIATVTRGKPVITRLLIIHLQIISPEYENLHKSLENELARTSKLTFASAFSNRKCENPPDSLFKISGLELLSYRNIHLASRSQGAISPSSNPHYPTISFFPDLTSCTGLPEAHVQPRTLLLPSLQRDDALPGCSTGFFMAPYLPCLKDSTLSSNPEPVTPAKRARAMSDR